ncbi:MAG: hypothetical protein HY898_12410 [Deltaproteobacteria bacterium]|nr:hypothetical protein [Deltaproteobacteria bacterium]
MKHFAAAVICTLAALLAPGCTRTSTPMPPTSAAPTATMLFCAYGGVGTVPDPLPPGYETDFASMVIEVDNPGSAISGVTVAGASLLDEHGAAAASLRRVDHFVVLPTLEKPGPKLGIFAVYLNPEGTAFTGDLPTGRTKLRVRMSIARAPSALPARCRLNLGGVGASPLVIEGKVDGSWPT